MLSLLLWWWNWWHIETDGDDVCKNVKQWISGDKVIGLALICDQELPWGNYCTIIMLGWLTWLYISVMTSVYESCNDSTYSGIKIPHYLSALQKTCTKIKARNLQVCCFAGFHEKLSQNLHFWFFCTCMQIARFLFCFPLQLSDIGSWAPHLLRSL